MGDQKEIVMIEGKALSFLDRRPLVSVVIPCYNRRELLKRAIKSVLAQTFNDFELIVVDDGSKDNLTDVVKELGDLRVQVVRQPTRQGAAKARNVGIEASSGKWVAFLDSDDEWLPTRLELQMKRLADAGSANAAVGYCLLLEHNVVTGRAEQSPDYLNEGDVFDDLLRGRRPRTASAYVVKRSVLLNVNGFDEAMPTSHDIDLWLRLAQKGHLFSAVNEVLLIKHYHHGLQLSNVPLGKLRSLIQFDRKWGSMMRQRLGAKQYWKWKHRRSQKVYQLGWMRLWQEIKNGKVVRALQSGVVVVLLLPRLISAKLYFLVAGKQKG